jgi:hypothetical protein
MIMASQLGLSSPTELEVDFSLTSQPRTLQVALWIVVSVVFFRCWAG